MARNGKYDSKRLNNLLSSLGGNMDNIYKNTYYSDNTNAQDLAHIADDIEDNIARIIRRNKTNDISGVSQLYARMKLKSETNSADTIQSVRNMFDDNPLTNDILAQYTGNKWIEELDAEIDTVLKYCTKMEEALELMRDAVIASDSLNKDYINSTAPLSNDDEVAAFQLKMSNYIQTYKIKEKLDEWYMQTAKYGEQYVYVVPYKTAIAKLLNNRKNANINPGIVNFGIHESADKSYVLTESVGNNTPLSSGAVSEKMGGINIEFDLSYTLRSAIESQETLDKIVSEGSHSLNEAAKNTKGLDVTIKSDLEVPKELQDKTSHDGLIATDKTVSPNDLKVRGAVVKSLRRKNIIPLYVDDDTCLGYYYIEMEGAEGLDAFSTYNTYYSSTNSSSTDVTANPLAKATTDQLEKKKIDELIRAISAQLSKEMNTRFVNANQDLTKEIYAILLHNDIFNSARNTPMNLRISFLPEEDVLRLAYNIDKDTHRGISDCLQGLIPAKLFSCMYITDVIGMLTRGQDRRVYYVKQTVDTNISQTLLNVINQIKKSNFGIRQIQNLNHILNITGRFNDFVIPVGPSGDAPVQMEVMPGQQFDMNKDLYDLLEEMAVNSTGVNIELVQNRNQPDFATQFTSSSIKVLRTVLKRQSITEDFLSKLLTKIYACEHADEPLQIEAELPPPMFLMLTNTSQLIQNANEYATAIATFEYDGVQDEKVDQKKAAFIRKMNRHLLGSYIKSSLIDKIKKSVDIDIAASSDDDSTNNDDSGDDYS